jgi:CelD/BcsL family acetyltransferase involved in cellulose biosynthesis
MRVSVVRPDELGSSEASLWARFQHASPLTVNPFLSLTFARTVGRHRPNARVAVIEDDGEIQAFLPFERGALATGLPIGYPMNDLHGFIGSGAPINARLAVRKAGLRGWRFDHAPAEQLSLAPYHYAGVTVKAPVMDVRDGYDAYLGGRSKNFRKVAGKKRRALERQFGPLSVDWGSPRPAEVLGQLIGQKSERYHGTRLLFADQTARKIVEELAAAGNADCQGVVSVVSAGGKPLARFMGLLAEGRLSAWFASYDPELGRFSPGILMYLALAEEAASRGITLIDLCSGQDLYKFHLANDSYPVAAGAVWVSRAEAAGRQLYRRLMLGTTPLQHAMPTWVRARIGILGNPGEPADSEEPMSLAGAE